MSALDRTLLAAFAIFAAATGVFLLAAPQTFYANVPGVAATGSFNAHFLRDVGLAYVTLAVGAAFALFRPEYALPVTAMAAVNLLGHAALHVFIENSRRCIWERHDRTRRGTRHLSPSRLRSCTADPSSVRGSPAAFSTKNLTNRKGCIVSPSGPAFARKRCPVNGVACGTYARLAFRDATSHPSKALGRYRLPRGGQ